MDIFESLGNLNVSEECFDDILGIVEEYINEVSIKRWKEAAKNSYHKRDTEYNDFEAQYKYLKNNLPTSDKEKLEKDYKATEPILKNRVDRAKYLADNLPNSSRSASKLKKTATDTVKSRSDQTDKFRKSQLENMKKSEELRKEGNDKEAGKIWDKGAQDSNYQLNFLGKEDHARILAGKPLRDVAPDGNYVEPKVNSEPLVSYKKENKFTLDKLKRAEDNYDKMKKEKGVNSREFEQARSRLLQAQGEVRSKFLPPSKK